MLTCMVQTDLFIWTNNADYMTNRFTPNSPRSVKFTAGSNSAWHTNVAQTFIFHPFHINVSHIQLLCFLIITMTRISQTWLQLSAWEIRVKTEQTSHVKQSRLPGNDSRIIHLVSLEIMYSDQHSQSVKDNDGLLSTASIFASLSYHVRCKYEGYQHFFAMTGDEHVGRAIPLVCSGTRDTPATYVVPHGCTDADMTAAATTMTQWLSSVARAALHFPRGRAGSAPSHLSLSWAQQLWHP